MNDTLDQATAASPASATHERRPKVVPYAHRWWIDCEFVVTTPLAVGNGGQQTGRLPPPKESKKLPQVNTVAFNTKREPYVPATGLKGALRALSDAVQPGMTALLFGAEPISADGSPVRKPGFLDVHDAHAVLEAPQGANPTYTRATVIETSTRIDRDRGTVADRALFNDERVDVGTRFKASFFVQCHDKAGGETVVAQLLGLFNAANDAGGLALGADTGRGFGRVQLASPTVKYFDNKELARWQANGFGGTWISAASVVKDIAANTLNAFSASNGEKRLTFDIQFSSLFLVNDPERTSTGENAIAHAARIDASGKPVLPARSLQGALRSQSERILRTLGIACCGAGGEECCDTKSTKREEFCLACQLYGNTKLSSRLTQPTPPTCEKPGAEHTQDFIAIDRFTGGGKDGAKFNARGFYQPKFRATLALAGDVSPAARGLLLLTLRDLADGDIPLGWGKRKGYGECTVPMLEGVPFIGQAASALTDDPQAQSALAALRNLRPGDAQTSSLPDNLASIFAAPPTPSAAAKPQAKMMADAPTKNVKPVGVPDRFHNTYHFIPIEVANLPKWATVSDFKNDANWANKKSMGTHSHARYGNSAESPPVFSGRIECTITAETPFIVGGARTERVGHATIVAPYEIDGKLVIPATTLKGMIGSIAEAASGSAMRIFDGKQPVSYRSRADLAEVLGEVGQLGSFQTRDGNGDVVEHWFIRPLQLARDWSMVTAAAEARPGKVLLHMAGFGRKMAGVRENVLEVSASLVAPTTMQSGDYAVSIDLFESVQHRADERTRKQHPRPNKVSPSDYDAFRKAALPYHLEPEAAPGETLSVVFKEIALRNSNSNPKSAFEQMRLVPRSGDIVRFRAQQIGSTTKVIDFGYSAIWRGVATKPNGSADLLENFLDRRLLPASANRDLARSISPAELLLGFVAINETDDDVEQAPALAGKLRFTDAVAVKSTLLPSVPLKILSSPKPPSPSLYFKLATSTTGTHIAKRALNSVHHVIKGRKHYLHALQKNGSVAKLDDFGAETENGGVEPWRSRLPSTAHATQGVTVTPLDVGSAFNFSICFDNLTLDELALLAFSLAPSDEFSHKLGLGKPIGLGTVKIKPTAVLLVDRVARYGSLSLGSSSTTSLPAAGLTQLANSYAFSKTHGGSAAAKNALRLLGNPHNVKLPVHYPQLSAHRIDEKTYEWFVENDRVRGTGLKALDGQSSQIPDLPRTPVGPALPPQRRK